ncbi:MAG: hypothetical protein UW24_C0011G0003 [Parcubacteria group bacterium GW2011_GWA2_44_12]|nr:MAG: hypothetical protein UW24_C0011G0003 [Parcubacteria group bacterium GW2011_GWA2_44_12]
MLYMVIAAKNFRRGSEGAAEGGCGGNSAAPERRSPAAPPEYLGGGTEQKNILFLFRRKNRSRAKSEMWRMFFCEVATGALAEAGGGAGHRPSKKVRAKDIISPPSCTFSEIARSCLGAKRLGMVFFRLRK